eukprot:4039680-Prymnesium_polylepis.1
MPTDRPLPILGAQSSYETPYFRRAPPNYQTHPLERNLITDTLLTTMGARVIVRGVLPVVRSTIR